MNQLPKVELLLCRIARFNISQVRNNCTGCRRDSRRRPYPGPYNVDLDGTWPKAVNPCADSYYGKKECKGDSCPGKKKRC